MIANICGSIFFFTLGMFSGAIFTVWTFGGEEVKAEKRRFEMIFLMILFGCGFFWAATRTGLIWS